MIKQLLLERFKKSTSGNNITNGERVLKNDLISDFNYDNTEDKIVLFSSVISEDLYSQYSCKLDIDKKSKEVLWSNCTCNDFEKNSAKKENYCCKHIVATFFRFLNLLDEDIEIKEELGLDEKSENIIRASQVSMLDYLIGSKEQREEIKFEVILNKISWTGNISAEFKIGLKTTKSAKLYLLKDIDGFLVAMYNNVPIPYGKDYTFNIKTQKLSMSGKRLIKFIELLKEIDLNSGPFRKINEKLVSGKQIIIPKAMLKQFLTIIKDMRVYLGSGFYSRTIETEILLESIPIPLTLKELGSVIKLEAFNSMPEPLTDHNDVFLYNTVIYIPSDEQCEKLVPYIEAFSHGNALFFTKDEEKRVLSELIPSIQKVTNGLIIAPSIQNKIVIEPVKFKFYFDKADEVELILKVCYGKYEFNYFYDFQEKVIYRDTIAEEKVIEKLKVLGFEAVNNKFIFMKGDDYVYKFFKEDILELQSFGEIYYSDTFKGIKNISSTSFKGTIKKGKYDYFELNFKIGDIDKSETLKILEAFRNNRKYYKLENGEYLDLEEIELRKLLKLIDVLEASSEIQDNRVEFAKNKGIFLEEYLKDNEISYIRGRNNIKSIRNSVLNLKKNQFAVPESINATLRNYQVVGYNWLKSLDYLGFGGILGDEMGLGKTLQTITFLASNKEAKTLIVAPTSLIYNWYKEFKKFSPLTKVAIISGTKDERIEIIKKHKNYDVLITTYNMLKRDLDLYKNIEFTYCIIDEAQNIKNHLSQNAIAVKSINAKNRFALTGTPIENSLMELWSIFDFVMPGYLYDEKNFSTRYHRRLEEEDCIIDELKRLTHPFILRRYKKDVLKELPSKIEKKLVVPLNEEQKRIYGIYAKYAKDLIEKKVEDDELKRSRIEILAYMTKLRQICLDPSVIDSDYKETSGKLEALLETVNQAIEEKHKILVFSQFTSVLKNISTLFNNNDISHYYLDGATTAKKRNELVNNFNNDDTSVFLISLKAGGTGLNLTSADLVIHFDPWWNPAVEDQATDRAHRIGQQNVVEVIKMVSEGTIEEKIIDLQEQKRELIEKVIGTDFDSNSSLLNLTDEDIISLFIR